MLSAVVAWDTWCLFSCCSTAVLDLPVQKLQSTHCQDVGLSLLISLLVGAPGFCWLRPLGRRMWPRIRWRWSEGVHVYLQDWFVCQGHLAFFYDCIWRLWVWSSLLCSLKKNSSNTFHKLRHVFLHACCCSFCVWGSYSSQYIYTDSASMLF